MTSLSEEQTIEDRFRESEELRLTSRIRAFEIGTIAMSLFAIPFVFINWIAASHMMGILLAVLIGVCLAILAVLRRTRNTTLCGHLGVAAFFLYLLSANVLAGGFYQPGIAWLLLIPLTGALLVDVRAGWYWTGIVAVSLIGTWALDGTGWIPPSEIPEANRPAYYLASVLAAVVGIGVLANSFTRTQRQLERVLQAANERIAHMAFYDSLTGLPNRQLFRDRLEQALAGAARGDRAVGLLFIDLNEFKAVNDTLGHAVGDSLLKEVSSHFSSALRLSDTISLMEEDPTVTHVSRLGGDEFTVLLTEVDGEKGATVVARRLISAISRPLLVDGNLISVSASIGIAVAAGDGTDSDWLLSRADAAMYRAKARGRNQIELASGTTA